jgi:hypothetical protein
MPVPIFTAGEVYTAEAANKIGLYHIATIVGGNGTSSVVCSEVFSSDFVDYKITISGGTIATAQNLRMRLGSTSTGYYAGYITNRYDTGALLGGGDNNATYFTIIGHQTAGNGADANITLSNPAQAVRTGMTCMHAQFSTAAGAGPNLGAGFVNNSTAYSAFTIFTTTGNWTSDITISVYGFNANG